MRIIEILCTIILIFIVLIIFESAREIKQLRITSYNIKHPKLPKEFYGYKAIIMADLHNSFYSVDKIIDTIKKEKPNCVIVAGDMLVYRDNQKEQNIKSLQLLHEISKYADVYFTPGNHEMGYMQKNPQEWLLYEKQLLEHKDDNLYFLDNKYIELNRGNSTIRLYGIHLTDGYYKRFVGKKLNVEHMEQLLGISDASRLNILIAHNPDYFDDYCNWGADIVISGHNHGGLMRIPLLGGAISPRLRIFPKYDYGLFYKDDSILVLSGGLGAHSLKIRVNNKPELIILELTNK